MAAPVPEIVDAPLYLYGNVSAVSKAKLSGVVKNLSLVLQFLFVVPQHIWTSANVVMNEKEVQTNFHLTKTCKKRFVK
jgi:hypothetical protein